VVGNGHEYLKAIFFESNGHEYFIPCTTMAMVLTLTNRMQWHVNGGQKEPNKETKIACEILKKWMMKK